MPAKGQIDPSIRDENGNRIPWKTRNRDRANAATRKRMAVRKQDDPLAIKRARRKWFIKMKFGLTPEIREALIKLQYYKCAICDLEMSDVDDPRWSIDHCHTQDYVRGMLCRTCNSALGLFKDNPEILRSGASYLEESRSISEEACTDDFIAAIAALESVKDTYEI